MKKTIGVDMDIVMVDNFFDNFEEIENEFKKIKLYNCEEHSKLDKPTNLYIKWPGKRSDRLDIVKPELFNVFQETFFNKLPGHPVNYIGVSASMHVHLRLAEDNKDDYIHTDKPTLYSCIVYLNETDFNSGTTFYMNKNNPGEKVKEGDDVIPCGGSAYVKNRLIIFDSNIPHSSIGNFGENIYNGRLTLNTFFNAV